MHITHVRGSGAQWMGDWGRESAWVLGSGAGVRVHGREWRCTHMAGAHCGSMISMGMTMIKAGSGPVQRQGRVVGHNTACHWGPLLISKSPMRSSVWNINSFYRLNT